MRRRVAVVIPPLGALLAAGAAPAAAAVSPVSIEVTSAFGAAGSFAASGAGICSSGTVSDGPTRVTGGPRSAALTFHLERTFVCDDGSGTFTIRIQARVQPCDENDYGSWVVARGTGDYEDLHGAGTLVGTYFPTSSCEAEGIVDRLSGMMRVR